MRRTSGQQSPAATLALGGAVALAASVGIGRFVYTPILPAMAESLSLPKASAGLIASANFLGYLLGALAAAAPRLPGARRSLLTAGLVVGALTTGAMGLGAVMWQFLLLRFLGGAASAFVLVSASALVLERLAVLDRRWLSGLHFAGVGAGIALSALIVSMLTYLGVGWRGLWFGSGAASAAAVPVVAWLVPADPVGMESAGPRGERVNGQRIGALAWAYGLFGFGYVVTATFLVAIVRSDAALRPIEPWVWLVVGVAASPSVALWNRLALWTGLKAAFAAACLVEATGVAASVLWPTRSGLLLSAVLLGATMMGITALGLQAARRLGGVAPQRALGLATAAFGVGQIIGPLLAGSLYDWTGSFLLPSTLAAGALVVSAVTILVCVPLDDASD